MFSGGPWLSGLRSAAAARAHLPVAAAFSFEPAESLTE